MKKLTLFLLLVACAKQNDLTITIDPTFNQYIQVFYQAGGPAVNVNVGFADLTNVNAAGECIRYGVNLPSNIVYIDRTYWNNAGPGGKQQVVLHELGHCVLGLNHDPTLINLGSYIDVPRSIMYPIAFGDEPYYTLYNTYYTHELIYGP